MYLHVYDYCVEEDRKRDYGQNWLCFSVVGNVLAWLADLPSWQMYGLFPTVGMRCFKEPL